MTDTDFVQITATTHDATGQVLLYALTRAGDVWQFDFSPSKSQNRSEASNSGTIVPSSASFGGGSKSISEPPAEGNATVGRCM